MESEWPMVKLEKVLTERTEKPDLDKILTGEIPIVAKIGFNTGKIELREEAKTKTNMILIKPGDLVISGINAAKGAIAIYGGENTKPAAATIHYSSYEINKKRAEPLYLWYFFRSETFRQILISNLPNGIKTEVKPKRLLPLEIPLPSLEEQKRIVARIENLTSRIEEARDVRAETIEKIKGILQAKIRDIIKNGVYIYHWRKMRLPSIVSNEKHSIKRGPFGSSLRKEFFVSNGYKVYEQKNVIYDNFKIGHYYIDERKYQELNAFEIKPDDIVISCSGTIGKVAIVPQNIEKGIINQALLKITLNNNLILPVFFKIIFESDIVKQELEKLSPGSAMKNITSVKKLKKIDFVVPPISIQRRIVAYLDSLQAKVDELKRLQTETEKEMEELIPSILDKAFKGEL